MPNPIRTTKGYITPNGLHFSVSSYVPAPPRKTSYFLCVCSLHASYDTQEGPNHEYIGERYETEAEAFTALRTILIDAGYLM